MAKKINRNEDIKYPIKIVEEDLPELTIIDSNGNILSNELIINLLNSTQ